MHRDYLQVPAMTNTQSNYQTGLVILLFVILVMAFSYLYVLLKKEEDAPVGDLFGCFGIICAIAVYFRFGL